MFALSKLAYLECDETQKHWYNTVPNNVIKFDIEPCCQTLKLYQTGKLKIYVQNNFKICSIAADAGHLDCLELAHKLGFQWERGVTYGAACNGHLDCLIFAINNGCRYDSRATFLASSNGSLNCLKYLHEIKVPWEKNLISFTATYGHLNCIQYAYENGCPWDIDACYIAAENGHFDIIRYAEKNGCPMGNKTFKMPGIQDTCL